MREAAARRFLPRQSSIGRKGDPATRSEVRGVGSAANLVTTRSIPHGQEDRSEIAANKERTTEINISRLERFVYPHIGDTRSIESPASSATT